MVTIKRELINKKYMFVAREKGRFISKRIIKGSNLRLSQAKEIFKRNSSFNQDIIIQREKLTNVTEIRVLISRDIKVKKKIPRKPNKDAQYVVGARIGKQTIWARSNKGVSLREGKQEAYRNVYARLDQEESGGYDDENGFKIFNKKVSNIKEGWVYYK